MDVFTTICICSGITLIVIILMSCLKQTFLIQPSIKFLYSDLLNILYLYFVQNWICQKATPIERLFRSYIFIKLMDILTSQNTAHAIFKFKFQGANKPSFILMKTRISKLWNQAIPLIAEAISILA